NNNAYLVMPFIEGGTLKQFLGSPIPFQQAAQMLIPIANALESAHQMGIIHRDVKPANILITANGSPMLSDFGIAKILQRNEDEPTTSLTGTGVGIGTPEYMSPEQGQGLPVDGRTDVYSLGIVFYEMVAGRKPFRADTPLAVLYKHVNEPLPPIRQYVPHIPNQVESLITVALAKDPASRFASMKAMATALGSLMTLPSLNPASSNVNSGSQPDLESDRDTFDNFNTLPTQDDQSPVDIEHENPLSKNKTVWIWLACIVGLFLVISGIVLSGKFIPGSSPTVSETSGSSSSTQNPIRFTSPPSDGFTPTTGNTHPTPTNQPTPVPTYYPLTNCGPSRLQVGDSVYVSMGGTHNDIRTDPDTHPSDNTIVESYQGDILQIISGPECDASGSHWVMWQVRTSDGNVGWTPESDGTNFWLTPLDTYPACSGALMSRLHPGDHAQVSNNGVASTMRQDPNTSAEIIDFLSPGLTVEILAGPTCSDGYVWFQVQSDQSTTSGWTVESDSTSYWLIPIVVP
ncbi:MAG TPA: protein kinase, partial [Longilinea sp.]|nr:protein kinase [Longilinea sp.]